MKTIFYIIAVLSLIASGLAAMAIVSDIQVIIALVLAHVALTAFGFGRLLGKDK